MVMRRVNETRKQFNAGRNSNQFIITPTFSGSGIGADVFNPSVEIAKQRIKQDVPSIGERKEIREEKQLGNRINQLIGVFDRAYPAVRSSSMVNKVRQTMPENMQDDAYWRRLEGVEANSRANLGFFDENPNLNEGSLEDVKLYNDLSEGFITTLARRAGEQRVSDQDAKRFRRSLMGFGGTPRENMGKKQALLNDLQTLTPGQMLSKYTGNPAYAENEMKSVGSQSVTAAEAYESDFLPPRVSQQQLEYTMKKHGLSKDDVLKRLGY